MKRALLGLCLLWFMPALAQDYYELKNRMYSACDETSPSYNDYACDRATAAFDAYVTPLYGKPKADGEIVVCGGGGMTYNYNTKQCEDLPRRYTEEPVPISIISEQPLIPTIDINELQRNLPQVQLPDLSSCVDRNGDGLYNTETECGANGTTAAGTGGREGGACLPGETQDAQGNCVASTPTQNPPTSDDPAQPADEPVTAASPSTDVNVASLNEQLNACRAAERKANQCCTAPESCIGEALGMGGAESGLALGMIQTVMGGAAMAAQSASSIGAMCGKMKNISYAAAIMNTALGTTCQKNVSQCKSACGELEDAVARAHRDIDTQTQRLEDMTGVDANEKLVQLRQLDRRKASLPSMGTAGRALEQCATYDNQVVRSAQAAMASAMAAKMASNCKENASNTQTESIASNNFNVDCTSPGAAANPVCQQQCSRPGAENDPVCKALLQQLNPGAGNDGGFGITDPNAAGGSGGFDVGDDLEEEQLASNAFIPPGSTKATSVQGGTGGLSGGLGGAGGGGGDDGIGGGGAGAAGLDGKLIRGYASSNGPTAVRGGYGGYGRGGAGGGRSPASKGKPFKLTDFLPGGKLAAKRHISGFGAGGSGSPEIGPATANIFQMISNRYYLLCSQDRLYDCDSLKKRGCPINAMGGNGCPVK